MGLDETFSQVITLVGAKENAINFCLSEVRNKDTAKCFFKSFAVFLCCSPSRVMTNKVV